MPNAIEKNEFLRGQGLRPRPRSSYFIPLKKNVLQGKTTFFTLFRVRDSSEKPAMSEANEDL
jgi:hypothetical protein